MSINIKIYCSVDKILHNVETVNKLIPLMDPRHFDKDGNPIDVYFKSTERTNNYIIIHNDKAVPLTELEKKFNSFCVIDTEFSIMLAEDEKTVLLHVGGIKNEMCLLVFLQLLSEFFYNTFGKEVEF